MQKMRKISIYAFCAVFTGFIVIACPVSTDGNFSGIIRGYNAKLPAPKHVIAEEDEAGAIIIHWDAVTGADGYNVYRSKSGSSPSLRGGVGKTTFTDKGKTVVPDTPYSYFVTAYQGEEESEMASATPKPITPSIPASGILPAPEQVNAEAADGIDNAIILTWEPVPGATGYRIYRSSSYDDKQYIFKHESTTTTYTDSNLAAGDYTYQISAVDAFGKEGYPSLTSDIVTIAGDPNAPPAPKSVGNLRARIETEGTLAVTLTWAAADSATKYHIYRSEDGETYAEIGFADGQTTTTYTDASGGQNPVEWGKSYYYRVRSFNGNQEGYLSKACGPVVIKPMKPVITGVSGGAGNVTVFWSVEGNANGFKVYRSKDNTQFVLIGTAAGDETSFADVTVAVGQWYYRVIAYNSGGDSLHSESYSKDVPEDEIIVGSTVDIQLGMHEWESVEQRATASPNTDKIFTVSGTYTSYQWYLDGVLVPGAAGTGQAYTFNQGAGRYELVVVASGNGRERSGSCWITVE